MKSIDYFSIDRKKLRCPKMDVVSRYMDKPEYWCNMKRLPSADEPCTIADWEICPLNDTHSIPKCR